MSRLPAKKKHNQPQADNRKSSSAKITGARLVFVGGVIVLGFGTWRSQFKAPPIDTPSRSVKADKSQVSPESTIAPDPPRPARMIDIDPLLSSAIHERLDRVTKNRNDPEAWGKLGVLYEANGYRNLALRCYAKAFDLDRTRPRWRFHWGMRKKESGDFPEANRAFQDVLALQPNHAPTFEQIGKIAMDQLAYDRAEIACKKVIELRPNEAGSYVGLAKVFYETGQYEKTLRLLDRAIQLDAQLQIARFLRGQTYRALGRVEEAAVELRRGAGSDPVHIKNSWQTEVAASQVSGQLILARAGVYIDEGLVESGIQLLEELKVQIPEDLEVDLMLAWAYLKTNQPNEAKRVLTNLISSGKDDLRARIHLSTTFFRLNEPMLALKEARNAVELAPDNARTYLHLGYILGLLGRLEESLEAYLHSYELDPSYPDVYLSIGRSLVNLKRVEEAIPYYDGAIQLSPKRWHPMFTLGVLYAQLGRNEEAIRQLEKAIALKPGHPQIQKALNSIRSASGKQ